MLLPQGLAGAARASRRLQPALLPACADQLASAPTRIWKPPRFCERTKQPGNPSQNGALQGLPSSIRTGGRPSREDALQAVAALNRIRRLLGSISDATVARVAPFATALGRAAGCDPWAVEIFAEEVVRVGGAAF